MADLEHAIQDLYEQKPARYSAEHRNLFVKFRELLNRGAIRAAEPDETQPTGWRVNAWVKKGILLGFRMGGIVPIQSAASPAQFFDKSTYPLKSFTVEDGVRIVPGGSSIRDGCYI